MEGEDEGREEREGKEKVGKGEGGGVRMRGEEREGKEKVGKGEGGGVRMRGERSGRERRR